MASNSTNADPWMESGLPDRQVSFFKKYFEDLDSETDAGATDWAECWAENGDFIQGTMILKGPKGLS